MTLEGLSEVTFTQGFEVSSNGSGVAIMKVWHTLAPEQVRVHVMDWSLPTS